MLRIDEKIDNFSGREAITSKSFTGDMDLRIWQQNRVMAVWGKSLPDCNTGVIVIC